MAANCEWSDICNVQGDDAEYLLNEINFIRKRLTQPMPRIMRQELMSDIEKWKMVLEDSGHLICYSENGYDFKRIRTGPL